MLVFLKNPRALLYAILLGISLFPLLHKSSIDSENVMHKPELFRRELVRLNSIEKVVGYVDSIYDLKTKKNFDTLLFVSILNNVIKERFRYGQSDYSLSENWIARLSGKLFWPHISAIVNPDDILKRKEGLCSQQTIVFMEALKRKNINVRTVGLGYKEGPGHFLCEVMYNGEWHLHDVTLEPKWNKISNHHKSINYYLNNKDSLYAVYQYCWSKKDFNILTSEIAFGKPNEFPAKNMLLLHRFTLLLTYCVPGAFLLCLILSLLNKKIIYKRNASEKKSAALELIDQHI
jgi:hypothetical protein